MVRPRTSQTRLVCHDPSMGKEKKSFIKIVSPSSEASRAREAIRSSSIHKHVKQKNIKRKNNKSLYDAFERMRG
jgi:hypothetical protein